MRERVALVRLEAPPQAGRAPTLLPEAGPVTAIGYSLFKHGDGGQAVVFGRALAGCYLQAAGPRRMERLFVTSSGFGEVPPAAHALVPPFARRVGVRAPVTTFEVRRRGISAGDYAAMTPGARKVAVRSDCMSVAGGVDLRGARVVALDDIRVTGTHERAMDECLTAAGAARVDHVYLVDAHDFADQPAIESQLNLAAVPDVDALLGVVAGPTFVPNARVCRRVMQLHSDELTLFVTGAPEAVLAWMLRAVDLDRLDRVGPYRAGVTGFRQLVAQLGEPEQTATA